MQHIVALVMGLMLAFGFQMQQPQQANAPQPTVWMQYGGCGW